MKTYLLPLVAVAALSLSSYASAAVIVHAGPVHVAVGVRPHAHPRPVFVAPQPVFVPAGPAWSGGWNNGRSISPHERREIREEARELRAEIRDAGAVVSPAEQREIREERRELGREIRRALSD